MYNFNKRGTADRTLGKYQYTPAQVNRFAMEFQTLANEVRVFFQTATKPKRNGTSRPVICLPLALSSSNGARLQNRGAPSGRLLKPVAERLGRSVISWGAGPNHGGAQAFLCNVAALSQSAHAIIC